jgi:MFS family permease
MLGSRVSTIAYPMLVLAITSSPVTAGWACFAATAPTILFYLPAGVVVDRCNPRRMILCCESVRGLAVASVVTAFALRRVTVPQLIVVAVFEGILEVFSTLAERRFAQSLIDPEKAATALAQSEARTHIAIMAGRPLGAMLFSIARYLPFIADSVSFGICVGTLMRIRNRGEALSTERATIRGAIRDIGEGISWICAHRFAGAALFLTAGTTLISQALIMIFLSQAHADKISYPEIGVILACSGVGGAAGADAASRLFRSYGYSLFGFQLSVWVVVFVFLASPLGQSFTSIALAMTALGFTGALGNVALDMYIFRHTRAMLARVIGIGNLISFGALALGPLLGGILFKLYGMHTAVLVLLAGASFLRLAEILSPIPHTQDKILTLASVGSATLRPLAPPVSRRRRTLDPSADEALWLAPSLAQWGHRDRRRGTPNDLPGVDSPRDGQRQSSKPAPQKSSPCPPHMAAQAARTRSWRRPRTLPSAAQSRSAIAAPDARAS